MPVRCTFQLLFALYLAGTLGVLVPSHHHEHRPAEHAAHGHARAGACHSDHYNQGHDHESDQGPVDHTDPGDCSICLFARGLTAPPTEAAPVMTPEVVNIRPADAPTPIILSSFVPTLFGRAPPPA